MKTISRRTLLRGGSLGLAACLFGLGACSAESAATAASSTGRKRFEVMRSDSKR